MDYDILNLYQFMSIKRADWDLPAYLVKHLAQRCVMIIV